jgi:hypothetical protein
MTLTDLYCHVDIGASASRVWSVLADLDHYREWNPWIRQASGRLATGATLELVVADPPETAPDTEHGGPHLLPDPHTIGGETLRPVIERVTPVSTLVLGVDWLDVEGRRTRHELRIEPIRSGTRLHQSHAVVAAGKDGAPDPFPPSAVRGVELMNAALKARAER